MIYKKKKVIIVIAAVVIAVLLGTLGYSNVPSNKLKRNIALGEKYLTELNYEQAVAAFKEALKIAPQDEAVIAHIKGAYDLWAQSLIADSEYENAVARMDEARVLIPDDKELIEKEADIYKEWASYFADTVKDLDRAMEILKEGYDKLGTESLLDAIKVMEDRVVVRNMSRKITVKATISFVDISAIHEQLIAQTGDEFIGVQSHTYVIKFSEPVSFRIRDENGTYGEEITLTEAYPGFGNYEYISKYFSTDDQGVPLEGSLLDKEIECVIDPYVEVAKDYQGELISDTGEAVMGHATYLVFPNGIYTSRIDEIVGY